MKYLSLCLIYYVALGKFNKNMRKLKMELSKLIWILLDYSNIYDILSNKYSDLH